MTKRDTRSPINNLPVRQPGQSLRDEIGRLIDDEFMPWVAAALAVVFLAVFEWYRYFVKLPPQP